MFVLQYFKPFNNLSSHTYRVQNNVDNLIFAEHYNVKLRAQTELVQYVVLHQYKTKREELK